MARRGRGLDGRPDVPDGDDGLRRFARVVGFALAVQIQLLANVRAEPDAPGAAGRPPAPPAPPARRSPAAAGCRPVAPVVPPARRRRGAGAGGRRRPGGRVRHGGRPDRPRADFGVLAWTHVAIELAAQTSVPATTRRADGAGFSQQHLLLGAAGCALQAVDGVRRGERGRGQDVRRRHRSADLGGCAGRPGWRAPGRGPPPRTARGRRGARGRPAALTRWRGTLDNLPVWTAPRFAAALGVDALVRFHDRPRRSATALALCLGLSALGCVETRDLGSTVPHGALPVDQRNPVILANDSANENWQGEYAILLSSGGGPKLAGIVVNTSGPWPDIGREHRRVARHGGGGARQRDARHPRPDCQHRPAPGPSGGRAVHLDDAQPLGRRAPDCGRRRHGEPSLSAPGGRDGRPFD